MGDAVRTLGVTSEKSINTMIYSNSNYYEYEYVTGKV